MANYTDESLRSVTDYLNENITEENFGIFTRLSNIKNQINYNRVLDLLATYRLSLEDINSLEVVSDYSIAELLNNFDKKYTSKIGVLFGGNNSFHAEEWLFGINKVSSPVAKLFSSYKLLESSKVNKLESRILPSNRMIRYGLTNGSAYSSESDYMIAFNDKILNSLLSKYNTTRTTTLIPTFTGIIGGNTGQTDAFAALYMATFFKIRGAFSNTKLYHFFMQLSETPTFVVRQPILIADILNVEPLSKVLEVHITSTLSALASLPNLTGLSAQNAVTNLIYARLDELYALRYEYMNLTDYITTLRFANALEETLYENYNLPRTTDFNQKINKFISDLQEFKILFLEIEEMITSLL